MVDRLTGSLPEDSTSKDSSHNCFYLLVCCSSGSNFSQHGCGLSSKARILGESYRFPDHRSCRSADHCGRFDLRSFISSAISALAVVAQAIIVWTTWRKLDYLPDTRSGPRYHVLHYLSHTESKAWEVFRRIPGRIEKGLLIVLSCFERLFERK